MDAVDPNGGDSLTQNLNTLYNYDQADFAWVSHALSSYYQLIDCSRSLPPLPLSGS